MISRFKNAPKRSWLVVALEVRTEDAGARRSRLSDVPTAVASRSYREVNLPYPSGSNAEFVKVPRTAGIGPLSKRTFAPVSRKRRGYIRAVLASLG